MRYFRGSFLSMTVLAVFCVFVMGLAGCGKKEEVPVTKGAEVREKSATEAQQEARMPSLEPITEERTFYDFETVDLNGWEVPMWAQGKSDHVAKEIGASTDVASKGKSSMKIMTDFPGDNWAAALVEIQQYLNLRPYRVMRADIYLPEDAPIGLKAKIILTVGSNWKFVEMSRSVPLIPGEWTMVEANIEPGSYDWKRIVPDEEFAEDVRKVAIRIVSNRKPKYTGPIYVDNVRVGR